jgi:hypothetical protein
MKQTFTQLDLVRFLYKESLATETVDISEAIHEDSLLREEYEELFMSYRQMPKAKFSPKPATLKNILNYSAQTAFNPTH